MTRERPDCFTQNTANLSHEALAHKGSTGPRPERGAGAIVLFCVPLGGGLRERPCLGTPSFLGPFQ